MKHIKFLSLLLMVSVLAFSCSKKSNPAPAAAGLSLKFNGTLYTASGTTASYSKSQNALQVIGTFGTTGSVYLAIPSGVKVGTFDLSGSAAAATFSNGADVNHTYLSTSGSLVITTFTSTTVAGTFQFTGGTATSPSTNGVVTEGKFQTTYTNQ